MSARQVPQIFRSVLPKTEEAIFSYLFFANNFLNEKALLLEHFQQLVPRLGPECKTFGQCSAMQVWQRRFLLRKRHSWQTLALLSGPQMYTQRNSDKVPMEIAPVQLELQALIQQLERKARS